MSESCTMLLGKGRVFDRRSSILLAGYFSQVSLRVLCAVPSKYLNACRCSLQICAVAMKAEGRQMMVHFKAAEPASTPAGSSCNFLHSKPLYYVGRVGCPTTIQGSATLQQSSLASRASSWVGELCEEVYINPVNSSRGSCLSEHVTYSAYSRQP